jgi:hypothetical protein
MDQILIDDVTLRVLTAREADVDAWLRSLEMVGWTPEPSGSVPSISNATINGFMREPVVHGTHVELGERITFTRCGTQPGPQLFVGETAVLPQSVLTALVGRSARTIVDHDALTDARILSAFNASGHLYVDLDMPMHPVETSIGIAAIKRRVMAEWGRGPRA